MTAVKEKTTELTLNQAIIKIRNELQSAGLQKSGQNKFAGFKYFELADFLPTLNRLMEKYDVNDIITIEGSTISLSLVKGEEVNKYAMPFVIFETPLNNKGAKSMQDIQYLGALNTYYKRYLYLNAFGITDGEVIDSMDNSGLAKPEYISEELAEKYHNVVAGIAQTKGKGDGSVSKWFLDHLGVINYHKITTDKVQLANELINKLSAGE